MEGKEKKSCARAKGRKGKFTGPAQKTINSLMGDDETEKWLGKKGRKRKVVPKNHISLPRYRRIFVVLQLQLWPEFSLSSFKEEKLNLKWIKFDMDE